MRISKRKPPKVGTSFERSFAEKHYTLKVVSTSDGIAYELNGRIYKTPTTAAKTITKYEVNGWLFWHMEKNDHSI